MSSFDGNDQPDVSIEALRRRRPRTRSECQREDLGSPLNPCPYVSCEHHMLIEVRPNGEVRLPFGTEDPSDLEFSCIRWAASRAPWTLEEVGTLFGLTRERVRQIEAIGLRIIAKRAKREHLLDDGKEVTRGTVPEGNAGFSVEQKKRWSQNLAALGYETPDYATRSSVSKSEREQRSAEVAERHRELQAQARAALQALRTRFGSLAEVERQTDVSKSSLTYIERGEGGPEACRRLVSVSARLTAERPREIGRPATAQAAVRAKAVLEALLHAKGSLRLVADESGYDVRDLGEVMRGSTARAETCARLLGEPVETLVDATPRAPQPMPEPPRRTVPSIDEAPPPRQGPSRAAPQPTPVRVALVQAVAPPPSVAPFPTPPATAVTANWADAPEALVQSGAAAARVLARTLPIPTVAAAIGASTAELAGLLDGRAGSSSLCRGVVRLLGRHAEVERVLAEPGMCERAGEAMRSQTVAHFARYRARGNREAAFARAAGVSRASVEALGTEATVWACERMLRVRVPEPTPPKAKTVQRPPPPPPLPLREVYDGAPETVELHVWLTETEAASILAHARTRPELAEFVLVLDHAVQTARAAAPKN